MAILTTDFLNNRRMHNRYKMFAFAGIISLAIAGSAAVGYFLYQKYEKPADTAAGNAQENSGELPREWLVRYFGTDDENNARVGGSEGDPDEDILTNEQEFFFGTDPTNPDTLGDGQLDGVKVVAGINPVSGGPLYNLDYAKLAADRFIETNNLPEFKKENIEKQVLGLLNPPDPSKLQIDLPDPKTLKVSSDNSAGSAAKYMQDFSDIIAGFNFTEGDVQNLLNNESGQQGGSISLTDLYDTINKLRNISVPSDFLKFHQLHIAGLFASANILEINKLVDPNIDIEAQQSKIQEQYRNVAIIEKVNKDLVTEIQNLQKKYQDQADKIK